MDEQRGLTMPAPAGQAVTVSRRACCAGLLAGVGAAVLAACGVRRRSGAGTGSGLGTGVALRGRIWPGGTAEAFDGLVVVGRDGRIAAMGPAGSLHLPAGLRVLDGAWVGPGIVDAHVHLAFGAPSAELAGGLVAVRDLGAPPGRARDWRTPSGRGAPGVAVAGPMLTVTGGYPTTSWGAGGFGLFLDPPERIRAQLRSLVADGVDLIKIALESGGGSLPVPDPGQVLAVVEAAHDVGLRVTAHALTLDMVGRALAAGVDELAHVPTEVLPAAVVEQIAGAGIPVVSTLQTFFTGGAGRGPAVNAAALHAAGATLVYGTDLGNGGTSPGVDPRELDRLADAGLGRAGALRAATEGSAAVAGLGGRGGAGRLVVGEPARLVLLAADPLVEPAAWRRPLAVLAERGLVAAGATGAGQVASARGTTSAAYS